MYHIYKTEGWVVHSTDVGEANKFLELFTAELGMVRAMAQGVRKLDSKLRYGLQDYSFSKISLVKGRELWRVVNAERLDDFSSIYQDKKAFKLACRIFSLLKRMVAGQEKDGLIFEDLNAGIKFMMSNRLSEEEIIKLEIILVFRILHKLGYVPRDPRLDSLADFSEWSPAVLRLDSRTKSMAIAQINSSLAHSHL